MSLSALQSVMHVEVASFHWHIALFRHSSTVPVILHILLQEDVALFQSQVPTAAH
jgi:hypothetical protein